MGDKCSANGFFEQFHFLLQIEYFWCSWIIYSKNYSKKLKRFIHDAYQFSKSRLQEHLHLYMTCFTFLFIIILWRKFVLYNCWCSNIFYGSKLDSIKTLETRNHSSKVTPSDIYTRQSFLFFSFFLQPFEYFFYAQNGFGLKWGK